MYNLWLKEQADEWTKVAHKSSKNNPLTGANSIPLGTTCVLCPAFQNSKSLKSAHKFAITHFKPVFNPGLKGILCPVPTQGIHFGPLYRSETTPTCQSCGRAGHFSGNCRVQPRVARPGGNVATTFGDRPRTQSLPSGLRAGNKDIIFTSFGHYSSIRLGISPPPPLIVPWSHSWSITAPEFEDFEDESLVVIPAPPKPAIFSSFGDYAIAVLRFCSALATVHVAWSLKTPITVASAAPLSQEKMAFCFVDPQPFLPQGAQRMLIENHPLMQRVITG